MFDTQDDLRDYARLVGDNDGGELPADEIGWSYEPGFPVSRLLELMTLEDWRAWYAAELAMARDDLGDGKRWSCLLDEEIVDPIVLVEADGLLVWDGWHRAGAAVLKGAETIRVVLGKHPEPQALPGLG